ncbi:MAG: hypothetical protein WCG75_02610 [Armatimonadota bacterium]
MSTEVSKVGNEETVGIKVAVWKWLAGIAALLYLVSLEVRVNNLQILNNMVYDEASCTLPGWSKDKVRECFHGLSYTLTTNSQTNSDMVFPKGITDTLTLRSYSIEIKYDKNGILQSHSIYSFIGLL